MHNYFNTKSLSVPVHVKCKNGNEVNYVKHIIFSKSERTEKKYFFIE